jgi:hypothetical protein
MIHEQMAETRHLCGALKRSEKIETNRNKEKEHP